MGFQNNKKVPRTPNKQWLFLKTLAEIGGIVTWESPRANDTLKKTKQLLSEGLKKYFGLKGDPFEDYKKEHGYRIKIELIPVGSAPAQKVPSVEKEDDLGITEELQKFNNG